MEDCQGFDSPAPRPAGGILVLAVGNTLVGDDGAGAVALEALREGWNFGPNVDLVDGGTMGLYLIDRVAGYGNVLFLDSVVVEEPPGTVILARDSEVETVFRSRLSPHQAGINDLLSALALMGRKPARVALVGLVPERIDYGIGLSPCAAASIPRMAEVAAGVLREWGGAEE